MLINKTTLKKWITHSVGYGSGYTYRVVTNGYQYKLANIPAMEPGQEIQVEVYSSKSQRYIDRFTFYVPNQDEIDLPKPTKDNCRDYQRQRVYSAEDRMKVQFGYMPETLTLEECIALATEVSKAYDLDFVPEIEISNRKKVTSTSYGFDRKIVLAAGWGQSMKVVLHELAHQVTYNKCPSDPGHGRYFVKIMIDLYENHLSWDRAIMEDILKKHCVDYIK